MKSSQHGAATLIFSIVVLLLVTFVTLSTSTSIISELKIGNNDYRSKQAFEAAEAGIAEIFRLFAEGKRPAVAGGMFGTISSPLNSDTLTFTNSLGQIFTANLSVDGDFNLTSVGFSDDLSATKTITIRAALPTAINNLPENPLTARGAVNIGGAANIYNSEGASTIWAGGDVAAGVGRTYIANPSTSGRSVTHSSPAVVPVPDANGVGGVSNCSGQTCTLLPYPQCLEYSLTCELTKASDGENGVDVISNDSALAELSKDEVFINYTGEPPSQFRNQTANVISSYSNFNDFYTNNPDDSVQRIIWFDGDSSSSGGPTFGCSIDMSGNDGGTQYTEALTRCELGGGTLNPVMIVVDGDLTVAGNLYIFGALIVLGDLKGSGSVDVTGALVVTGSAAESGSKDIRFSSRALQLINENAVTPYAASGGWSDF